MAITTDYIKSTVRTVPDWPQKGVMFRDITPIFSDPKALRGTLDTFVHRYFDQNIDVIAGIDARGFLLGVTIAYELNLSFVPIRKKGKLPYETISESYLLEYGEASVELHTDAIKEGQRVVLFDDLIATGGTMIASANLIKRLGGNIVEAAAIIDLPDLGGSKKLNENGIKTWCLFDFEGL